MFSWSMNLYIEAILKKQKVYSWYIKWYTQRIWHGLSTVFQEDYEKILKIY